MRPWKSIDQAVQVQHPSLGMNFSRLCHDGLLTTKLALNLLPSPPSSVNCAWLEFAVGLGLLDHSSQPILSESIDKLTTGERLSKVTGKIVRNGFPNIVLRTTYPITPIDDRIKASLRFISCEMRLSSWKTDCT